jgi:manganese/zinc/iron transport system permease protein
MLFELERLIIDLLLNVFSREEINQFLRDPQHTAVIVGSLIAVSGALLGTFLLLRGLALTSDAISHTVLLGIVVAFLVMTALPEVEAELSSPWLIIGAALSGVATVVLTELIYRSGLVRQDAALGLAFPLLFAVSIILISRYADDVHLDEHAVMVGEIGVAWADANRHCFENCETVDITPEDERANIIRECVNCRELAISPRDAANDDRAIFRETCTNCGEYSPRQAFNAGFTEGEPVQVFWPKSITVNAVLMLLSVGFVTVFYKELKLAAFDEALAKALGFRPGVLHYALMILVSLVAVGAFDAVGSILVIAFFIIPPAAAYLLTDRLAVMLVLSAVIGSAGAFLGYELVNYLDTSPSAAMVLMMLVLFAVTWMLSPKYGLVSTIIRRANQRRRFDNQVVMGHIYNHQHIESQRHELTADELHEHFRWSQSRMERVLSRLRSAHLIDIQQNLIGLTPDGEGRVQQFRQQALSQNAGH